MSAGSPGGGGAAGRPTSAQFGRYGPGSACSDPSGETHWRTSGSSPEAAASHSEGRCRPCTTSTSAASAELCMAADSSGVMPASARAAGSAPAARSWAHRSARFQQPARFRARSRSAPASMSTSTTSGDGGPPSGWVMSSSIVFPPILRFTTPGSALRAARSPSTSSVRRACRAGWIRSSSLTAASLLAMSTSLPTGLSDCPETEGARHRVTRGVLHLAAIPENQDRAGVGSRARIR